MTLERVCFHCDGPAPAPLRLALAGVGAVYVCSGDCRRRARYHHGQGRRLELHEKGGRERP
jgi:hypothetical protein